MKDAWKHLMSSLWPDSTYEIIGRLSGCWYVTCVHQHANQRQASPSQTREQKGQGRIELRHDNTRPLAPANDKFEVASIVTPSLSPKFPVLVLMTLSHHSSSRTVSEPSSKCFFHHHPPNSSPIMIHKQYLSQQVGATCCLCACTKCGRGLLKWVVKDDCVAWSCIWRKCDGRFLFAASDRTRGRGGKIGGYHHN